MTEDHPKEATVPVDELEKLKDRLLSKQEKHIERGKEKQSEIIENYHYGFSDGYKLVADDLKRLVKRYE